MKCPRCQADLKEIIYEGVEIDTCASCGGEWLDDGEMKKINDIREETFTSQEIGLVKGIEDQILVAERSLDHNLLCPHCSKPMRQINYASTTGVVIDKCPDCKGIWLDKDELENVQILVEGWETKLGQDSDTYRGLLSKIEAENKEKSRVSRSPLMQALINGFLIPFGL
ncbi:zf-TFIIB domain-containing protein [Planctomycetota bacterium]